MIMIIINLWKKSIKNVNSKLFGENMSHGLNLRGHANIYIVYVLVFVRNPPMFNIKCGK